MANRTISALASSLDHTTIADADLLVVDDVSDAETKKITVAELTATIAPTASAQAIDGRTPPAEGVSTSLARADHLHSISLVSAIANTALHALAAATGVLLVDTSALDIAVQLPAPGTVSGLLPLLIVDTADASAHPITIKRAAAEKIDGVAADKALAIAGGRWWLWTDGTDWYSAEAPPLTSTQIDRIGALVKNNLAAGAAPTTGDDSDDGYSLGSLWVWADNGVWICADAAVGAAAWLPVLLTGSATLPAVGTGDPGVSLTQAARVDHVHSSVATVETEAGATRNTADADSGKLIRCTNAGAVTITAVSGLTAGVTIEYAQVGAGTVTIAAGGGVTLNYESGHTPATRAQYTSIVITYVDGTTVLVRGALA